MRLSSFSIPGLIRSNRWSSEFPSFSLVELTNNRKIQTKVFNNGLVQIN